MAEEKDKADAGAKADLKPEDKNDSKSEAKEKVKKPKLTRVIFSKNYMPYKQGEMAGLEPDVADKLIADKVCSRA
jgi:hypothetical protein